MDPYQLSRLVFSPLDFAIIVVPLMQCSLLQWIATGLRDSTPLAIRPGALPHTRSWFAPPSPAPGASHTWPGSEVESADPASSCWESPPCSLGVWPGSSLV